MRQNAELGRPPGSDWAQRPACIHRTPWGVRCPRCLPNLAAGELGRPMQSWERDMLSLIESRDGNGRRVVRGIPPGGPFRAG
jgi:hypothetical protein